jgi:putative glutathione S-transferase
MGMMIDGVWRPEITRWASQDGRFVRAKTQFHGTIEAGGRHAPEPGRYHLYVSYACPWAHRTLIMRALKKLEPLISISVTHWLMREQGWTFTPGPDVVPDPLYGTQYLYELYARAVPRYTGRVTVPVLWDKVLNTIVNNESAEIIRIFNSAFDALGARPGDYYPEPLRQEIDALNARIYDTLNNGVYKAGFATTQAAYEEAIGPLFATLEWLEQRLSQQSFLTGEFVTEADIRLFTTLIRFDAVYATHFKCNLRRIVDFPNLWDFTRAFFQHPEIRPTVNFMHIKRHYYESHRDINPYGIVPLGPVMDFDLPARRRLVLPS